ncbi:hypothetical protein FNH05_00350 [Amycolatopsis rhizosphaerae]|uniref:Uncharacterized protein n=1 Tax=Amycolatopsis rhizosphaerae TaxID=2053003 RepID=A0A558DPB4_9PSEU|nr:DUF2017 family protein [Amycolatopsis rhizosphaerae]TVT62865.1 hypothetical protein FNH05_00350 [Amycolatopsis rhizosphaerae]
MADFVNAWPTGDGGATIVMSDNAALSLRSLVTRLRTALEPGRKSLPDHRLFPDAYAGKRESEDFRARHGAEMRAEVIAAADRVLAHWAGEPQVTLDPGRLRDWFLVMGHAQSLFRKPNRWHRRRLDRLFSDPRTGEGMEVLWLQRVQYLLATAATGTPAPPC